MQEPPIFSLAISDKAHVLPYSSAELDGRQCCWGEYQMTLSQKFDIKDFLTNIGPGRQIVRVKRNDIIYAQGAPSDALFYLQKGKVRLTVVSRAGRGATTAMLRDGDFFGEGSLAGQSQRTGSAEAIGKCDLMRIEKSAMRLALHRESELSDMFVAYLLSRTIRHQEDLVDQLFNFTEKRLARTLLLLGQFDKEGLPETAVPKISHETLAEMVGTTRSRVSFFMSRFRKLGFIDYDARNAFQIHSSLLNSVVTEHRERV
jgi:CRP/FNR family transcriptional regulator, cyclic AMP receptor protein